MRFQLQGRRVLSGILLSAVVFGLAGCQSGGAGGPFNLGKQQKPAAVEEGQVLESELRAYCPPVSLRSGTAFFTKYVGNDESDPQKAVYQAAISDVTRSCRYSGGSATMTIAVAGKVVPGPSGRAGTVTLPIRVVATRGGEVVYSKLFAQAVTISDTSQSVQFVFTDPNVTIPAPVDRGIKVLAGFDEGGG